MADAKLDSNSRPALTAVSSSDGETVVRLYADPSTHRLLTAPAISSLSVFGAGSAYALTDTAAAINLGTTDPVLTVDKAGSYLVFGQVNLAYTAATVAAETATIKVRRTNNTAADISQVVVIDLPASTLLTYTYGILQIPPFVYTTSNTDDSISLFANVSADLSAGTIDATAVGTSLVAVKLS